MSVVGSNILAGSSGQATGYDIDQSLRFDDGDSAYLSRTPGSAGNRRTWTLSWWEKKTFPNNGYVYSQGTNGATNNILIGPNDTEGRLWIREVTSSSADVFGWYVDSYARDPAAWYHFVVAVDTTQVTSTDRVKVYINGVQQTLTAAGGGAPSLNLETELNNTTTGYVGAWTTSGAYKDGYLAEFHLIDGTALDASSFGQTDAATNQWKPIEATGLTYGTNGFYQKYAEPHGVEAFTTAGSHTWTCPTGVTSVEVLTVAGGGGGGNNYYGGGGGAGGVVHDTTYSVTPGVVYDITVGAGGAGNNDGSDSVFNVNAEGSGVTLTAEGGGKGADSSLQNGASGGSGGGASGYGIPNTGGSSSQTSPSGATGYGNAGGVSSDSGTQSGGGGGGAGAVGGSSQSSGVTGKGGAGGAGREFSTFSAYGVSGYFGGGGGGGAYPDSGSSIGGAGGQGGGGTGGKDGVAALAGTANTGGGGGGATYHDIPTGGAGGLGVVLIAVDAGLGADSSGNGNNFAVTNLVATDKMLDTPTNNYCTLNPLVKPYDTITLSEGNLQANRVSNGWNLSVASMGVGSGKWYWEFLLVLDSGNMGVGLVSDNAPAVWDSLSSAYYADGSLYYGRDGELLINNSYVSPKYGATYTTGDLIGVALDMDAATPTITFYKNNVSQGTENLAGNFLTASYNVPDVTLYGTGEWKANFGQDSSFSGSKTAQGNGGTGEDFYYTPPTGYVALNTDNLPDPEIALPTAHFNSILWTGDGTSPRSFTGVGFTPDFTWTKNRGVGVSHMLYDTVRGAGSTKSLESNADLAEGGGNQATYGYLSAFGSDGFTTTDGSGSPNYYFNQDTQPFVSWNWKGGGAAASNTDGTITSSVSANPTAGFSIAAYTGNGVSGATVGHGLSQVPEMVIVKSRDFTGGWVVYSEPVGNTKYLYLDTDGAAVTDSGRFNDTTPTASVFTLGDDGYVNQSGNTLIAYCFHSIEGYSKVGSYTGNGVVDGTFVYTGFRPAWLMIKYIDGGAGYSWQIADNKRNTYNVVDTNLLAESTSAEGHTWSAKDFVSNGFKLRTTNSAANGSSLDFLYIAFAESPFKYSNAR